MCHLDFDREISLFFATHPPLHEVYKRKKRADLFIIHPRTAIILSKASIIHNNLRKTFALFIYNFSLIDLIINYYFSSKSLTTRPTISRKFPFYSVNKGLRTRIARRRERREEKFPRGNVREVFSCVRQNVVRDHVGGERERVASLQPC